MSTSLPLEVTAVRVAVGVLLLAASGCASRRPADDGGDVVAIDAVDAAVGDAADAVSDAPVRSRCDLASTPTIETVATLDIGEYAPVALTLRDGRAFTASGYDFMEGAQNEIDTFDPATDSWSVLTPTLVTPENFRAAAMLTDGRVLFAGGFNQTAGSVTFAEIFDPSSGNSTAVGTMRTPREAHTATTLQDGTVLVAGGLQAQHFVFHQTGEIFDPSTGQFASIPAMMTAPRAFHAAVYLPSNQSVLLVGGDSGNGVLASAERYDAASHRFIATLGSRRHAGKAVAAVPLSTGLVLVAGGSNPTDGTLTDADLYDPSTDAFHPAAPMNARRMAHTLTVLADGRVLAIGGWSDSTTPSASSAVLEVYDPTSDRWDALSIVLAHPRHDHRAVLLPDCRVLVIGGQSVTGTSAPVAPLEVEAITVPSHR